MGCVMADQSSETANGGDEGFRRELAKILLEKGLFALYFVVLGLIVSLALHSYKEAGEAAKARRAETRGELAEFFWPLYFRVERDTNIWKYVEKLKVDKDPKWQSADRKVFANHLEAVKLI